ncbi:MAG TPA: hypothetical protein VGG19_14770 [Tepidisphaeraceae bacterium]|jgi:hypothetical protein
MRRISRSILRRYFWVVGFVAACCQSAEAATSYTYTNNTGTLTWNNSNNWSPVGLPGNGDSASIIGGGGAPGFNGWVVTYDYTGASVTLGTLTISHGGALLHGTDYLTIGDSTTGLAAANEYLGDGGTKGYGAISQTGGSNTVSTTLQLGVLSSDSGTYNISGDGSVTVSNSSGALDVGVAGTGTFNQNGGSVAVSFGSLNVANSGNGTYNLNSGSLTTSTENIGTVTGTGTFTQIGGTNTVYNTLNIGAKGSYAMSQTAGLSVEDVATNITGGTFTQTDASTAGLYAVGISSGASYSLSGSAALTIGSNTSGSGYYLNIDTGSFMLSQTAVLAVHGDEKIGINSGDVATFTQSGGQHSVDYGTLTLGDAAGSSGTYTMTGGTLTTDDATIGNSGTGTFTQSAGSNTVGGTLTVGAGSSYTMSQNAALNATGGENINGTFIQNGGTQTVGNSASGITGLIMTGSYQLNGGTMSIDGLVLIAGGQFTQPAGSNTITESGTNTALGIIGNDSGGTSAGVYTLGSGASLTVNGAVQVGGIDFNSGGTELTEPYPSGILNINGGSFLVTDFIRLWTGTGNAINFTAGTITTRQFQGDLSEFNWTGGTLSISDPSGLTIGDGLFFSNLSLNSGMTLIASSVNLGLGGTLSLDGGVLSSGAALNLSGGTLSSNGSYTNSQAITGYGTIGGTGGFNNSGPITINTGSIAITNAGGLINSGNVSLAPGAQLQLTGGTMANTGLITLNAATISGTQTLFNNSGGVITGYGTISTPLSNQAGASLLVQTGQLKLTSAITNFGTIDLVGPGATFSGSVLNKGIIEGNGVMNVGVTNTNTGEIRALAGTWLVINAMPAANAGKINLVGGTVEIVPTVSNAGTITGRGQLYADGGLTNTGKMLFSGGTTDLYGPVTNSSGGNITVTGGGTTTFYNAFTNNSGATLQVSSDSIATFESSVSGPGSFTGSGVKIFDGGSLSSIVALASVIGDTVVEPAASLTVGSFDENALDVEGSTSVNGVGLLSETNSLTIGSAGKLDLGDNSLAISYSGSSPASSIRTYLQNGYDAGHWDGIGGIVSSAAYLHAGTSLGYFDDGAQVLIKYTWFGDTNLDGIVNSSDLSLISPTGTTWHSGDFNYDGKVNGDDFSLFMLGSALGTRNISTTLPEPSYLLALVAAGFLFTRKSR